MYRNCIFCSADLGANESLEAFPVGRSIAFDGEKGRLWAVCPRCARWNLAPLEERWEAIEAGERLFRDSRLRAQSENVGLAKLREGTRLIRVGKALPGELALARYGAAYRRRHRLSTIRSVSVGTLGAGAAIVTAPGLLTLAASISAPPGGLVLPFIGAIVLWNSHRAQLATLRMVARSMDGLSAARARLSRLNGIRVIDSIAEDVPGWRRLLTGADLRGAHLAAAGESGLAVHLPALGLELGGWTAQSLTARRLLHLNRAGADAQELAACVRVITTMGGAAGYLERAANRRLEIGPGSRTDGIVPLALEMALHEDTERRAMEGELSMLQAMWREAEEIASIADRLPDGVPAAEPARIA